MEAGQAVGDRLAAGHEALARRDWQHARELLSGADGEASLGPDDLEALATAAFWTGRRAEAIDARERAYAAFVEAGENRDAARVAIALSADYRERMLAAATSSGWLSRAERLLDGEPECREHGEMIVRRASALEESGDFEAAIEGARAAQELGSRIGSRDVEVCGLQLVGKALVRAGRVDEGFELVDEATAAAVSGELEPFTTFQVYCSTIDRCREVAEYARASEWIETAERWCDRHAITGFPGLFRVRRAEIMAVRGAWPEAEQEARRAWDELRDVDLDAAGAAFYEVGEIRLRLGDLDGAEESFQEALELGHDALPGLARLRLQQGRADGAARRLGQALADESRDRLARARLLPAQADVAFATGDLAAAEATAAELEEIADTYGSPALEAAAAGARGAFELGRGEAEAARGALRRARQLWRELEAPYEEARARMLLGQACRLDGDEDTAELELRAAKSAFEQLGAAPDARRARELLGPDGAAAGRLVQRTFMFTDLVGSALVDAIGDEAWDDLVRWHDETLRSLFGEHGGEEVDHAGDGFFVAFPDEASGVTCALAVQRRLAEHRRTHGFAPQVRIGLHAAAAADGGRGYRGKGVYEAARIATLAEGGEILASRETAAAAPDAPLADPRRVTLKGISAPLEVVTLDWR